MATETTTAYPSGWARAFQAVAGAGEVNYGDTLPAQDWRVKLHGKNVFVDSRVPESQWPTPWFNSVTFTERAQREQEEKDRARFLAAAKANPVRLDVDSVYVCMKDHPSTLEGSACTVRKGSRALSDSEAVRQSPEHWRPER